MMKRKILTILLLTASLLILTACTGKKDDELSIYKTEVDKFYKTVSECDTKINKINSSSPNASRELLEQLDIIDKAFADFARADVPYEFGSVEDLADEASDFMSESVSLYHEAFAADPFDELTAGMAQQKYKRAIVRINYIGMLLQGKELEGEGISSYMEEYVEPERDDEYNDDELDPEDDYDFYEEEEE